MSGRRTTSGAFAWAGALDLRRRSPVSASTKTACPDRDPSSALDARFSRRRRGTAARLSSPAARVVGPAAYRVDAPGLLPPAGGLAVRPTETTAAMPEPDESDAAFQGSDPDATNSTAAAPRDDGELYSQAGVSGPWAPSIGVPPLPAVPPSADPNFVLANVDDDVQEAQRQTLPPQTQQKPQAMPPAPSGASGARSKNCRPDAYAGDTRHGIDRGRGCRLQFGKQWAPGMARRRRR